VLITRSDLSAGFGQAKKRSGFEPSQRANLWGDEMASSRKTFAAAACSWIDQATGLPEVDIVPITAESTSRLFLVGNRGYRFCNFMEVWFQADPGRAGVSGRGFTPTSGMYRGPSYAKIPSHAFLRQTAIFDEPNAVRFTQVVGARTVSPEVVGTGGGMVAGAVAGGVIGSAVPVIGTALGVLAGVAVGAFAGEIVLHQALGFPPIWSKIQMRIYRDGRMEAQLLQHSLFPSLTFYKQVVDPDRGINSFERVNQANGQRYYNALKTIQLPDWQKRGWGSLQGMSMPGPSGGNPWGTAKGVTGGQEILPSR
jgi:hypothetical protein